MKRSRKKKMPPLKSEDVTLLHAILEKLNVLLSRNVLQMVTTDLAEEFEAALKKRLGENNKYIPANNSDNNEIDRKFLNALCQYIQRFIDLEGFGIDWDKRRATALLAFLKSLEIKTGET